MWKPKWEKTQNNVRRYVSVHSMKVLQHHEMIQLQLEGGYYPQGFSATIERILQHPKYMLQPIKEKYVLPCSTLPPCNTNITMIFYYYYNMSL